MTREKFDKIWLQKTPIQLTEELWDFIQLLDTLNVKNILEIGTGAGGSGMFWKEYGNVLSVDILDKDVPFGFLKGDSKDPETIKKVKELMPEIDLLFIDGDHSEKAVYEDIKNYAPLARIVAFHDTYGIQSVKDAVKRGQRDGYLYGRKEEFNYEWGITCFIKE